MMEASECESKTLALALSRLRQPLLVLGWPIGVAVQDFAANHHHWAVTLTYHR